VYEDHAIAADSTHTGFGELSDEGGGHACVDSIASLLHYLHAHLGDQVMTTSNHAVFGDALLSGELNFTLYHEGILGKWRMEEKG
jgi:hypothetical protein